MISSGMWLSLTLLKRPSALRLPKSACASFLFPAPANMRSNWSSREKSKPLSNPILCTPIRKCAISWRIFGGRKNEFFRRTGAYTINHLFALREEIAKTHPEIVRSLLVALREANAIADDYRDEKQKSEAAWEKEVMGEEFSYSLKEGCARRSLDTLMEYQIQQGILDRKPELEDLFFP